MANGNDDRGRQYGNNINPDVLAERIRSVDRSAQEGIKDVKRDVERLEASIRWAWRTIGATLIATVGGLALEILSRSIG